MKRVNLGFIFLIFVLSSCARDRYVVTSIESSRIEITGEWDAKANPEMLALLEFYRAKLDSEMKIRIGTAAQTLEKGYPQSLLSNFSADAMKEIAENLWGNVDLAVVNVGGLRSTLNKGDITVENLYEIYSFDNRLVLLELPGEAVKDFFDFIAFHGGEGLSKEIRLIVKDRNVEKLEIVGKPVDENKTYRIATLDYLAEGNDGMIALKEAVNRIDSNQTFRDLMIQYIRKLTTNNLEVNAKIDNRITVHP
ncbi:MAG: 5'-nucleotidase C-terminal domain-containing protein [Dysgonamonadaceae bacterium]|jgi:2',3'-cyclic-nucleotide 2'-phosphodiesterase (5'-nucleotidase family)|nr:5'-nucleotidase C-terminal domain-containing protein [Dysgonamonadaceae bacterium]